MTKTATVVDGQENVSEWYRHCRVRSLLQNGGRV